MLFQHHIKKIKIHHNTLPPNSPSQVFDNDNNVPVDPAILINDENIDDMDFYPITPIMQEL